MSRFATFTLFCLLAACANAALLDNEPKPEDSSDLVVEGRGIRDRMRSVWDFFFGGSDDEDYGDYGNDVNSDVSSYTFYDPSSARRETNVISEDDVDDELSWGEMAFGAAAFIVPVGLLLAAFPAGLFTVAVKKRSFGDNNLLDIDPSQLPLMKAVQEGDLLALIRPECQQKLYCEISQLGKSDSASFLQRTFYYISNLVPENLSRRLRLQRMFEASRQNACHKFSCNYKNASKADSPSNFLVAPVDSKDKE